MEKQQQNRRNGEKRGTANRPNGQPLWGEELYEGGKARQARLQADFDEIRNVVDLPDPATSGGHAYIAAAGDSFEVFTANCLRKNNIESSDWSRSG